MIRERGTLIRERGTLILDEAMTPDEKVNEASEDSFPASDAPGWISGSASWQAGSGPVDLNRLDADELCRALGIERDAAERILGYRASREDGLFREPSEILRVEGLDPALAERIARRVVVYGPVEGAPPRQRR